MNDGPSDKTGIEDAIKHKVYINQKIGDSGFILQSVNPLKRGLLPCRRLPSTWGSLSLPSVRLYGQVVCPP